MTLALTLTPTRDFSFVDLSPRKERGPKMGFPPGYEPGGLSHHNALSTPARHSGVVAARAAISCPYDTCFYDVMGLNAFSSLPLVGFCWTEEVWVNEWVMINTDCTSFATFAIPG